MVPLIAAARSWRAPRASSGVGGRGKGTLSHRRSGALLRHGARGPATHAAVVVEHLDDHLDGGARVQAREDRGHHEPVQRLLQDLLLGACGAPQGPSSWSSTGSGERCSDGRARRSPLTRDSNRRLHDDVDKGAVHQLVAQLHLHRPVDRAQHRGFACRFRPRRAHSGCCRSRTALSKRRRTQAPMLRARWHACKARLSCLALSPRLSLYAPLCLTVHPSFSSHSSGGSIAGISLLLCPSPVSLRLSLSRSLALSFSSLQLSLQPCLSVRLSPCA